MAKNYLKQLYPITKLYIAIALVLSAFIINNYIYSYCMVIICGIIAYFDGKLKNYAKRLFFSLFWLLLVIFILQTIFVPSKEIWTKIGFITIYKDGFFKAVNLTSKITAFVSGLTMLVLITPMKEFTIALEKKGINPKAVFIITLTLQMIPELRRQSNIIMESQKARGVETEGNVFVRMKALIPIFIPLVLTSIVNTEEKAITLEARGYSIGEKRTILNDINETEKDRIIKIVLLIFIILCIIGRVLWTILK